MPFDVIAPAFLVLAIALSWPRAIKIFELSGGGSAALPLATTIASAINLSSLGLALSENGPRLGTVIALAGIALGMTVRPPRSLIAIWLSVICLSIYLRLK